MQSETAIPITSHVYVRAWEFSMHYHSASGHDLAFPVCTSAAIRRFMAPNLLVQARRPFPLYFLAFLMRDGVRPSSTLKYAFACLVDCKMVSNLIPFTTRIAETFPFLRCLELTDVESVSVPSGSSSNGNESSRFVQLAKSLPSPLWRLRLFGGQYPSAFFRALSDRIGDTLSQLELSAVARSHCPALFNGHESLFPQLRHLKVELDEIASDKLFAAVYESKLVSQLRCFDLRVKRDLIVGASHATPPPDLEPLAHIPRIGQLLADAWISSAPDFGALYECRELSALMFAARAEMSMMIDLSSMPNLRRLGENTCSNTWGIKGVILPATLEYVARDFCSNSEVDQIEFSPCRRSLKFVDTSFFAHSSQLQKLDTTPLLGKIGNVVGRECLAYCEMLQTVNLAGFKDAREIGANFLARCSVLERVTGCAFGSSVLEIHENFLNGTVCLAEFDFECFTSLRCLDTTGCLSYSALKKSGLAVLEDFIAKNNSDGTKSLT